MPHEESRARLLCEMWPQNSLRDNHFRVGIVAHTLASSVASLQKSQRFVPPCLCLPGEKCLLTAVCVTPR